MATQTFKRLASRNVTAAAQIGGYIVGQNTQVTVIGLSVSNVADARGTVDIYIARAGSVVSYLAKNAPLPVGGTLVAVGGDQKIVLQPDDYVMVQVNSGAVGDALMSLLELT
jgi:hypothetical protein